ncbi:hypothetical protein L3Q82_007169 [Scortum barcoo]|uniref:Uncharacterized protein n=1 Tax=Scortum barcoo TaxID=214431 RepID=A0ACB8WSI7_9TELE|nr:hypothetical protein L3Q82_007169 [Scortum barcoo]
MLPSVRLTVCSIQRQHSLVAAESDGCELMGILHFLMGFQFKYEKKLVEDYVGLRRSLEHTGPKVKNDFMLRSAFNAVIPDKLILKLHNLGLPSSLCHWIRDFLKQASGGDCSAIHSTNTIVKFADDTTIVGLISDNPAPYSVVLQTTTLFWNTSKTKEVIVDYRRSRRTEHAPLLIHGEAVERVNNIKFLGIHITSDLTWSMNTAHLVKKAQQRLFFLRKAETCWTLPSAPDKLLQGHNREHPLPQCSSVVWQLHCTRPKRT